ncbi:MAG TPA: acylphosphatase [Lachnospiraceae bacterium]|jgi:acylphosphatase|nr:acylphosphatase [Lachnospiraceae bacterium]
MIRRRIRFYGEVQGVGFRYTAKHAADYYGCTGWVSNLYDGSVLMEIQGEEEQIDLVIRSLMKGRWIRIERMDAKSIPLVEDERKFRPK